MAANTYKHTQVGWVILLALGLAAVVVGGFAFASPSATGATMAILGLCLILFPSLTIVGDSSGIEARFGPGLIRKRFRWDDVRSVKVTRNSWLMGWGIRWFGSGWMFNVSGFDAVELGLRNGKAFRLGTDDPIRLRGFIEERIKGR